MLMYNWNKIYDTAGGSAVEVSRIVRMLVLKQVPKNKFDPIFRYGGIDFSGESFLIHPDMLMYNAYKHSYKDIVQYLALASLRPIADYLASGLITLPIEFTGIQPELLVAYAQQSDLLGLDRGSVVFRYEEVGQQTVH